ncbi:hypothetical protein F2P81_010864 [Scophthalmus maximus]|uniref:Uncharacterized protein n=1 Tax=Scophthalmus maximus TaxID=52904 RepID=A0A6A4T1S4_SCOMX|nr:hypothetical protein F2P81_010864 [Scophthalmus maximus]
MRSGFRNGWDNKRPLKDHGRSTSGASHMFIKYLSEYLGRSFPGEPLVLCRSSAEESSAANYSHQTPMRRLRGSQGERRGGERRRSPPLGRSRRLVMLLQVAN